MKNLKKILLSLMVLFLAFAFIGCPAEPEPETPVTPETAVTPDPDKPGQETPVTPDPVKPGQETPVTPDPVKPGQETPAVTNNFKGKTFVGMTGEGEQASFASYIIFTSDKDCEVSFFGESIPATYTVADDVVTLTGTGKYAELQLPTTKLTDGKFSITIPPAVSGEQEDIVVSYAVGTLWTIFYDIPESNEDFTYKVPEEALNMTLEKYNFKDGDYTKDDATKTVTLTASGWEKVEAAKGD